jgi:DNA-binding NarL/FixJ family response regulator
VRDAGPDLALLDMAMPDSIPAATALARAAPGMPIIALAVPDSESHVIACAEAGIVAYVAREATLPDLVRAIEGAARGEAHCSPRVAGSLLRRIGALSRERVADDADCARLTARELEIVALIDRGLSNKEIARALFIELPTVKNHVHHILEKLGVRRRSEAAARVRAMRRGESTAA